MTEWPSHLLTLDLRDVLEIEKRYRVEVVEGVLTLVAPLGSRHQLARNSLARPSPSASPT